MNIVKILFLYLVSFSLYSADVDQLKITFDHQDEYDDAISSFLKLIEKDFLSKKDELESIKLDFENTQEQENFRLQKIIKNFILTSKKYLLYLQKIKDSYDEKIKENEQKSYQKYKDDLFSKSDAIELYMFQVKLKIKLLETHFYTFIVFLENKFNDFYKIKEPSLLISEIQEKIDYYCALFLMQDFENEAFFEKYKVLAESFIEQEVRKSIVDQMKSDFLVRISKGDSQSSLIKKMALFLLNELEKSSTKIEFENRKKIIEREFQNPQGLCAGLSVLAIFGLLTSDREIKKIINDVCSLQEKESHFDDCFYKAKDIFAKKALSLDSFEFFLKIKELLLRWDGVSAFSIEDTKNIERFIANVLVYYSFSENALLKEPNIENQLNLLATLENVEKKAPVLVSEFYSFDEVLKSNIVTFFSENIKPELMILFSSEYKSAQIQHVIGIYQTSLPSNKIFLFDSNFNDEKNLHEFSSKEIDKLVECIFRIFKNHLKNTRIKVFAFPE